MPTLPLLPHVLFLHGNGLPTGCYRQFLDELGRAARVHAPDAIELPAAWHAGASAAHAPARARRDPWPALAQSCIAALQRAMQAAAADGAPLALVGHSMGGYLSLMLARRLLPQQQLPVVLIDAPIVLGWRTAFVGTMQRTGLSWRIGPAPVAARRRQHWPSADAARAHFGDRDFTRAWAPGVLHDYLTHALRPAGDAHGLTLRIARDTERDIYATVACRAARDALLALRAAGAMPSMVLGSRSREMRHAGLDVNRRLFAGRLVELDTGHLVPFEQPVACAHGVLRLLGQRPPGVTA